MATEIVYVTWPYLNMHERSLIKDCLYEQEHNINKSGLNIFHSIKPDNRKNIKSKHL